MPLRKSPVQSMQVNKMRAMVILMMMMMVMMMMMILLMTLAKLLVQGVSELEGAPTAESLKSPPCQVL